MQKKKIKIIIISLCLLSILCFVLFWLGNRYLIEHVAIDNALNAASEDTDATETLEDTQTTTESATIDGLSYTSDTLSIQITPVTTGSGDSTITYFVADVIVNSSDSLKSAFAKNQFGTNIIEYTSTIASDNNAIFAINGDYYGFREDGIVIRNGVIFRDSPARMGLAFYSNGLIETYDETTTSAEELVANGVTQTLSFGPVLVKDSIAYTDFSNTIIDSNFGNRSIQNSNPRTGVGIISANHYVFIVVDGRSSGYSKGMTLAEFAKVFEDLGCTDAYNLDGGGSSTMYFNGEVVNNPLGKGEERGVSDILYIN